jgi:iron complex transport system substrate-binding protein
MSEPRIISLIASATEIVCALGYERALVGRSHECDYPPGIERLPACSEARIDIHASSREIDRQVRAAVREALSVYRVRVDELERLRPTHIITQTQCEVCAVSLKDVEAAVCELVGSRPRIVSLEPMELADVWSDIRRVADSLGDAARGEQLVRSLQSRLELVRRDVSRETQRPTVLCLEWLDPPMSGGNWIPELVELAGGRPLLADAGKHSPWIEWEDVRRADPDVIVVLPCGFDIPRIMAEIGVVTRRKDWRELRAVRDGRVYVTDGNQFFNRPGPRVVESAEILAEVFHHPDGPARHRGTGWAPLPDAP